MPTAAAARFDDRGLGDFAGVATRRQLGLVGIGPDAVAAQAAARRWRVFGSAVLLHNGEPTRRQWWTIARTNCGPRAVLTSVTAAQDWGLRGWERDEVHVLAPAGTRHPGLRGLVLHRVGDWSRVERVPARGLHALAPALLVGAAGFRSARPACGLLAAAVQQRLLGADDLAAALAAAPRIRHRAVLTAAVADIGQGAQALSEIDFTRLCRRHGLPAPTRQGVRVEPGGRRRYLDVEWCTPDGRRVAAEVDGALHLEIRRWVGDQLRQNEVVLGGTPVLRFPSIVVRTEEAVVADQVRRLLRRRS